MDWQHLPGFVSYLSAKRTVDDRALNGYVLEQVRRHVAPAREASGRLRVLDLGAGNGSFLGRMIERDLLRVADYLGVDADGAAIADGRTRLAGGLAGLRASPEPGGATRLWDGAGREVTARFLVADALEVALDEAPFDLAVACALLDLVHVPTALARIWTWLKPGGHFWFTLNFDGETIFLPELDAGLEREIMRGYHRSMDERVRDGRPAGDSRCGRNLFGHIAAAGGTVLAAGASDWIVHPHAGAYPNAEAAFLHHILDTIDAELRGRAELDAAALAGWVAARHRQVEAATLVYVAKQLDVFGRAPGR